MDRREEITRQVPSLDDEGIPDQLDPLPGKRASGDGEEGLPPPDDRPRASVAHGTTEGEQREGEPLDYKLRREEPDATGAGDWSGSERSGRAAEEAAMHVEDD